MVRWAEFAPIDLTTITQFVFGVRGDPDAIKVEFEDNDGGKTIFNLNGVTNSLQHWLIDASQIVNLDDIKVISFVVDQGLAGAGNFEGAFSVFVGGLFYDISVATIVPSSPEDAPITILPNLPLVNDLNGTSFEQHSSTNFTVNYSVPLPGDWAGVMVRWEGFVPTDLTAIGTFVVILKRDLNR